MGQRLASPACLNAPDPVGLGSGAGGLSLLPVLLCLGPEGKIRKRAEVRLSRERLPDSDLVDSRGCSCTAPLRTAFDGTRLSASLWDAVVFLDMMLTCGLVDLEEVRSYIAAHPGWKGIRRARAAAALALVGSRSPPETRLRLLWVLEARLPSPRVNQPLFNLAGRLLGYPDLFDEASATVVEYDGDDHRDIENHTADNAREELLEEHGLSVVRATRLDLGRGRPQLVARLIRARQRGLQRDRRRDRWTTAPPPWWREPR